MFEILNQLIDENDNIPNEIVGILLDVFFNQCEAPYRLACDVLKHNCDKLQPFVCQIVAEQIEQDLEVYDHVVKINRVAPDLLVNVLSQIEEELLNENVDKRLMATECLGRVFIDSFGQIDKNRHIWNSLNGRRHDKATSVRMKWCEFAIEFLFKHSSNEIDDFLVDRLLDPVEKVRSFILSNLSLPVSHKLLDSIISRCRDVDLHVRTLAVELVVKAICSQDYLDRTEYLVNSLFHLLFSENPRSRSFYEHKIESLLLCNLDADSFAEIWNHLSVDNRKAFKLLLKHKSDLNKHLLYYLQFISKQETTHLKKIVELLSSNLAEGINKLQALTKFFSSNPGTLESFRKLLGPFSYSKDKEESCLMQFGKELHPIVLYFIRKGGWYTFNEDLVVNLLKSDDSKMTSDSEVRSLLLDQIIIEVPVLFVNQIQKLRDSIIVGPSLPHLKAMSRFALKFKEKVPCDEEFLQTLFKILSSNDYQLIKHATRILIEISPDSFNDFGFESLDTNKLVILSVLVTRKSEVCSKTLIKELKDIVFQPTDSACSEWVQMYDLEEDSLKKVLALKILRKLIVSQFPRTSKDIIVSFQALFIRAIRMNQDSSVDNLEASKDGLKAIMRYESALALLLLEVDPVEIMLIVQDPQFQVRKHFTSKLYQWTASKRIPSHFITLLCLCAHDPSSVKSMTKYIRFPIEGHLAVFLRLLAHHPDISNLNLFKAYVVTFVDRCKDYSLLYNTCNVVKKYSIGPKTVEMYKLAEMFQIQIKIKAKQISKPIETVSEKIHLPKEFVLLDTKQQVTNLRTNFLDLNVPVSIQVPETDIVAAEHFDFETTPPQSKVKKEKDETKVKNQKEETKEKERVKTERVKEKGEAKVNNEKHEMVEEILKENENFKENELDFDIGKVSKTVKSPKRTSSRQRAKKLRK